jgi:hypothetical protein
MGWYRYWSVHSSDVCCDVQSDSKKPSCSLRATGVYVCISNGASEIYMRVEIALEIVSNRRCRNK